MAQTIVVLKRAHFFSIDNDIIDVHAQSIGAIGIAIYTVLARFANRRTGECWPAIARIQRTLKLGRSTVKRYLHRLEAAGLISVEERWSDDGDRTSNLYTLLNPDPAAIVQREQTASPAPTNAGVDSERGGSPESLPPVQEHQEGGSTVNPQEPDPQNIKNRTTFDAAALKKTPRQNTCAHPVSELRHIAGMAICFHCWSILEDTNTGESLSKEVCCPREPDTSQAA